VTDPAAQFAPSPARSLVDTARKGWLLTRQLDEPAVRPIGELDLNRPLLALDVDGPLNRFWGGDNYKRKLNPGPETVNVRTAHGKKFLIDFYPERIAELDRIVRAHGVNIGWLTSWGPNVKALIEQAFDGKLAGGFILKKEPPKYRGHRPADWKFTGLRDHLHAHPTPWAWVDDEQIAIAEKFEPAWMPQLLELHPQGLPIHVDEREMITEAQLAQLDAFYGAPTI
jgi:hypothetical protein